MIDTTNMAKVTHGRANMALHTRPARQLFYGKEEVEPPNSNDNRLSPTVSLIRFCYQILNIQIAAIANDPFADWTLVDIEDALKKAESDIDKQQTRLNDLLSGHESIQYELEENVDSARIPNVFHSPLSFTALRVLLKFDHLARTSQATRNYALISTDDRAHCINSCSAAIRNCFELVNTWRHTGVSREDIAANNSVARRAIEVYSSAEIHRSADIPEGILRAERRFKHSQTIRTNRGLSYGNSSVSFEP